MKLSKDFTFSQSSLQSYTNCQYQFYLKYVRQLDWPSALLDPLNPAEIERQAGIRFHQLAQNFLLGFPEDLLLKQAQIDDNPKMMTWFSNFIRADFKHRDRNSFPELTYGLSLNGFSFSVKFDLLVLNKDKIEVFDWKTSNRPPRAGMLRDRIQTQLYPLVARSVYQNEFQVIPKAEIRFTYWEALLPKKPVQFNFYPSDLHSMEIFLTSLANEITLKSVESYQKTTRLERCAYCLYRTYCQRPHVNSYNSGLEEDLLFLGQDFTEVSDEK